MTEKMTCTRAGILPTAVMFIMSAFVFSVQAEESSSFSVNPVGEEYKQRETMRYLSPQEKKIANLARVDRAIMVPMRDGIRLATDILYPINMAKKNPVVLLRTPYIFSDEKTWWRGVFSMLLSEGYIVILQYERGKFWSEGDFKYLAGMREDGYDTVDWIANQPWSNGKVGTFGCSSTAENQLGLMAMNHPAHAAAIPLSPAAAIGVTDNEYHQGMFYRGGAWYSLWGGWYYERGLKLRPNFPTESLDQNTISLLARFYDLGPNTIPQVNYGENHTKLPVMDYVKRLGGTDTDFEAFIRRKPGDAAWREQEFVSEGEPLGVPALWHTSWYDATVKPNMDMFRDVRRTATSDRAKEQFAIVGGILHCHYGREKEHTILMDRDIGDPRFPFHQVWLDWFDYWLKGESNNILKQPRVQYYTYGINKWQSSDQWPPASSEPTKLYLHSNRGANSRLGDGLLSWSPVEDANSDTFIYDPSYPYPSPGDGYHGLVPDQGPFDQAADELRNDVLVYTSDVLDKPLEITGDVQATIYLSSSARDTDLVVRLVDVYPDGKAINLVDSIQRVRYREGYAKEVFMQPNNVYGVTVKTMSVSNVFLPGHRIRLEVASSHFPYFDRNLNTGGNNFDETEGVVARNTVHHSASYPSHIMLPVVK